MLLKWCPIVQASSHTTRGANPDTVQNRQTHLCVGVLTSKNQNCELYRQFFEQAIPWYCWSLTQAGKDFCRTQTPQAKMARISWPVTCGFNKTVLCILLQGRCSDLRPSRLRNHTWWVVIAFCWNQSFRQPATTAPQIWCSLRVAMWF